MAKTILQLMKCSNADLITDDQFFEIGPAQQCIPEVVEMLSRIYINREAREHWREQAVDVDIEAPLRFILARHHHDAGGKLVVTFL